MVQVSEIRTFKSIVAHKETIYRGNMAIAVYTKSLCNQDGSVFKTEEEVRVGIGNDKVQILKMKPVERGAAPAQQQQPDRTEAEVAGEYSKVVAMTPAEAEAYICATYVIPLYQ